MNRQEFIKQLGLLSGGVAFGLNGMPGRAYAQSPLGLNISGSTNGNIMVLVQLQGGNDGLNTVVPFANDIYYKQRPAIAIPKDKVLALNGDVGLHPAMTAFKELYDNNKLTVVENVGYQSPNRSHFRATDIWLSASDSAQVLTEGWVGRYLTKTYPEYPVKLPAEPMAIQLGAVESMLTQSSNGSMGVVFDTPDAFYQLVKGSTADTDPAPNTVAGDELKFLKQIAAQSIQYSDVIKKKADAGKNTITYPNTGLGKQLSIVAGLIAGGLTTPVYLTTIGGFDTHANQVTASNVVTGQHATLLKTVADAITAFQKDLEKQNLGNRVTVVTFSEFGRRVNQNGTTGTDHGTAAPMFVVGNPVRGGVVGMAPVLNDLDNNGDIKFKNDFRQVYASVLRDHLGMDAATTTSILGRSFDTLPIFRQTTKTVVGEPNRTLAQNTPNPFVEQTEIQYQIEKTRYAKLSIYDMQGQELRVLRDGPHEAGTYNVMVSGSGMATGLYLYCLQTDEGRQVLRMVKA